MYKRPTLGLSVEEGRVLERHWKGFVRSGAQLAKPEQERLAAISERLASLGASRPLAAGAGPLRLARPLLVFDRADTAPPCRGRSLPVWADSGGEERASAAPGLQRRRAAGPRGEQAQHV